MVWKLNFISMTLCTISLKVNIHPPYYAHCVSQMNCDPTPMCVWLWNDFHSYKQGMFQMNTWSNTCRFLYFVMNTVHTPTRSFDYYIHKTCGIIREEIDQSLTRGKEVKGRKFQDLLYFYTQRQKCQKRQNSLIRGKISSLNQNFTNYGWLMQFCCANQCNPCFIMLLLGDIQ